MTRALIAALISALIGLGAQTWRLQAEQLAHAKTVESHSKITHEAHEQALAIQGRVNEAQDQYTKAQHQLAERDRRISALLAGLRNTAPTASQLSKHTGPAVSEYAADIERDLAQCRDAYADMGRTAAYASAAAWTLIEGWPRVSR